MLIRVAYRLVLLGIVALILLSTISALAATNTVEDSGLSNSTHQATAEQLKPAACNGITLDNIVVGSGTFGDSPGNSSLMLGSPGNDRINGNNRNDCILGGAGNESVFIFFPGINGGPGNDVLLGGPGFDVLNGGPGVDTCNSGFPLFDTNCEF